MSDFSISVVPRTSAYPGKEEKAQDILDWLVSKDVVKVEKTDSILGGQGKLGHAVSEGAKRVVKNPENLPFNLWTNGLDIIIERMIYSTCQYGLDQFICPNCKDNLAHKGWAIFEDWYNYEWDKVICPICNQSEEIHSFTFNPSWGFSDLGFTFWNWTEFTPEFLEEFQRKLGVEIDVVEARI